MIFWHPPKNTFLMPHLYPEDQLVDHPAVGFFAALGWEMVSIIKKTFGFAGPPWDGDQWRGGAIGPVASDGIRRMTPLI